MKRKKSKKSLGMTTLQKAGLVVLIVGTLVYVKMAFFSDFDLIQNDKEEVTQQEQQEVVEEVKEVPKAYVNVFFIGQNENKEEVYRAVKREYNEETDGTKLRFAVKNLLNGPTAKEKAKGVYSEIPAGTRIIALSERPDKVVVNLSGEFETGGGTAGLYKRLYQLIKTTKMNTDIPVYLYINGKEVDVIGGEGLMITQPLNEKSLD